MAAAPSTGPNIPAESTQQGFSRPVNVNVGAVVALARASLGIKRFLPIAGNLEMCQIVHMDRDQIIAKLREYAPELKAAGVVHLFLHGSYARGTAIRGSSDVDVIAEFDPERRLSLVDMVAIENRLTDLLGVRVDLSPAKTLKAPVRHKAEREAVLAF